MWELLRERAVARGIHGSSKWWLGLAVAIYGVRLLRWMARRDVELVDLTELGPGESLVITTVDARDLKRRRRR